MQGSPFIEINRLYRKRYKINSDGSVRFFFHNKGPVYLGDYAEFIFKNRNLRPFCDPGDLIMQDFVELGLGEMTHLQTSFAWRYFKVDYLTSSKSARDCLEMSKRPWIFRRGRSREKLIHLSDVLVRRAKEDVSRARRFYLEDEEFAEDAYAEWHYGRSMRGLEHFSDIVDFATIHQKHRRYKRVVELREKMGVAGSSDQFALATQIKGLLKELGCSV